MNLPTPQSVVEKLALNLVVVAVVAALGYLLNNSVLVQGSLWYTIIKMVYDLLNKNTPNV